MKWILFDAYGTLFDAGKENIPQLAQQMAMRYQITVEDILSNWSPGYFELENKFAINFMTIMQANRISLAYAFGKLHLPITEVEEWMQKLIYLWSSPNPYEGVVDLIHDITINLPSIRIGVISNTDEDTIMSAIRDSDLPISYCMSSERAMSYKPDPVIFHKALQEMDILPNECIYIGNSIVDVIGATRAGIRCVYINKDQKPLPPGYDYVPVVQNLQELRKLLSDCCYRISSLFK